MNKKVILGLILILMMTLGVGCVDAFQNEGETAEAFDISSVDIKIQPQALVTMADGSTFKIVLLPQVAPNTVNNFIALSEQGFYDGLTFHRVMKDLIIQGGDPEGTGYGGPGYSIKGEMNANGYSDNTLSHVEGVISMARAQSLDSAGSQFFIMASDYTGFDGDYAAFGYVIEGQDIVNGLSEVEADRNQMPVEPIVIESITIERNGYEYEEVEKIES